MSNLPVDPLSAAFTIVQVKGDGADFWICTQIGHCILDGNIEGVQRFEAICAALMQLRSVTKH